MTAGGLLLCFAVWLVYVALLVSRHARVGVLPASPAVNIFQGSEGRAA